MWANISVRFASLQFSAALVTFVPVLGIALYASYLMPVGLIWLALMLAVAIAYRRGHYRTEMLAAMLVIALGLAIHALPGFNNPLLLNSIHVSPQSSAYSLALSLDKFTAGLIIFWAVFSDNERSFWQRGVLIKALPVLLVTLAATIAIASISLIKLDIKLSTYFLLFAIHNLLFTCMAEEAFFRGLIQKPLSEKLQYMPALLISAVLFGLAHFGAGRIDYVIAAIVAGTGYAFVYHRTGSVGVSMLIHWLVNLTHFVFFTYPFSR